MPSFPTITGGSIAKYPLTRHHKTRTTVLVFSDFSEQRFAKGSPLEEFELVFSKIPTVDKETIKAFFASVQGAFDTTWDLTIDDRGVTTYNYMQFVPGQQFEAKEEATGLWSFKLQIRQTKPDF